MSDVQRTDRRLLIVGASTRAAAESARRADFQPLCADFFADEDLFESADVLPLARYPAGLLTLPVSTRGIPWIFTGALENRPGLLTRLAAHGPLLGTPPQAVRSVRDPDRLYRVMREAGLPALEVRSAEKAPAADGTWMCKPRRGSAGRGIAVWNAQARERGAPREPHYFQRRQSGAPISALYLATREETLLIGATEQLIGESALNAKPFQYCGNVGPLIVQPAVEQQLETTGRVLGSAFSMHGLFGVDYLLDENAAWPTEVNPRYTASVEVFEQAWNVPILGWHVAACREFHRTIDHSVVLAAARFEIARAAMPPRSRGVRKAILYSPCSCRAPSLEDLARRRPFANLEIRVADRPRQGSDIEAGQPVCTILVLHSEPDYSAESAARSASEEIAARLLDCRTDVGNRLYRGVSDLILLEGPETDR